mgnify:CR=1 FL=1
MIDLKWFTLITKSHLSILQAIKLSTSTSSSLSKSGYTICTLYIRTFVSSAWSFVFFIPATTTNDLRLRKISDFYTRSYPLHYFLILILKNEPVFPFSMLSAKQGNYWYHFYNVLGMTRSLTGD